MAAPQFKDGKPIFIRLNPDDPLAPSFTEDECCCGVSPAPPPNPFSCLSSNGTCTPIETLGMTIDGLEDYTCTQPTGTYYADIDMHWTNLNASYVSAPIDWDGFSSGAPARFILGDPDNGDYGIEIGTFSSLYGPDFIVTTFYVYELGSGIGCGECEGSNEAVLDDGYFFHMTSTISMRIVGVQSNLDMDGNHYKSFVDRWLISDDFSEPRTSYYDTDCTDDDDDSSCHGTSTAMTGYPEGYQSYFGYFWCADAPPAGLSLTPTVTLTW